MNIQITGLKHVDCTLVINEVKNAIESDILAYGLTSIYKDAFDGDELYRDEYIMIEILLRTAIISGFKHLVSIEGKSIKATSILNDLPVIDISEHCNIYLNIID